MERLVRAEISRMSRLVNDLLLLAKAEQTQFLRVEPIDLSPLVQELWERGGACSADRRFELGPIPAGTLRADPDRLAQALRNLLSNAIAHTVPGEGLVRLTVEREGARSLAIRRRRRRAGHPRDQRESVFDRFHRTDAARIAPLADRTGAGDRAGDRRGPRRASRGGHRPERGTRIELELPGFTDEIERAKQPEARRGAIETPTTDPLWR